MRKRYWIPAIPGILAGALLAYGLMHPTVTVRLDRDEVQRRVDARLPLEGTKLGVAYSVTRADVELRPDGRVGVSADVTASALNRHADLSLGGSAAVAYLDGAFYLRAFKVERAVPRAVDEPLAEDDPAPQGRIAGAIQALGLRDRAAKALEASGIKDGAAFLVARKDAVVATAKDRAGAMLADAMEDRPVYRLKENDVRQSLAKLALQDVRVEDRQLVLDLNVMRPLFRVFLYGLAILLGLAAAIGFAAALGGGPGVGLLAGAAALLD